jgi:hypothetical protein
LVVKAIIPSLSDDTSWLDVEGTACAIKEYDGGESDFLSVFRLYLAFRANEGNAKTAPVLLSFLASHCIELKSLEVPQLRMLMTLIDWMLAPEVSLQAVSDEGREILRLAFREIRKRDDELDARIGSILGTAAVPSTDSLRFGSPVELAAFVHQLGRFAKSPCPHISTALERLCREWEIALSTQCFRLLAKWGDVCAIGAAQNLLARKRRNHLPKKLAVELEAAVGQLAKNASPSDMLYLVRERDLSFASVSYLLETENGEAGEDPLLCVKILNYLSSLPGQKACALRHKLVEKSPLLAAAIEKHGKKGIFKQRHQADLIERLARGRQL